MEGHVLAAALLTGTYSRDEEEDWEDEGEDPA
jgi:hypothetical protein